MSSRAIPPVASALGACVARDGERVRVLIADGDGLARRMMHDALRKADRVAMVGAVGNAREALELARYYRPAVLLTDTALPPCGCMDLIPDVLLNTPETRVLTISADDDETALAALRAGAVGHISKDVEPDQLARLAIRAADGEALIPRRLLMPLLQLLREVPVAGWRPLYSRLTTREWQIVELLADGASTERIVEQLVLSPTTVYSHVKSVMGKLGVHSRRDVVLGAERLRQEEAWGEKSLSPSDEVPPAPPTARGSHSARKEHPVSKRRRDGSRRPRHRQTSPSAKGERHA
jgi:DNA-binding NarL/FixJ family response regulator